MKIDERGTIFGSTQHPAESTRSEIVEKRQLETSWHEFFQACIQVRYADGVVSSASGCPSRIAETRSVYQMSRRAENDHPKFRL